MGGKSSKNNYVNRQERYVQSNAPRYARSHRSNNFGDVKPTESQIRNKLREEHSGVRSSNNYISNSQWNRMKSSSSDSWNRSSSRRY